MSRGEFLIRMFVIFCLAFLASLFIWNSTSLLWAVVALIVCMVAVIVALLIDWRPND